LGLCAAFPVCAQSDVPVSLHPDVQRAFAAEVGEANARTLQVLLPRVSDMYNVGSEDRMRYSWEVFGNELYRFVSGGCWSG
jgi:hypothetical protein